MGLRAGDDGLDLVLKILRDAPLHLSEDGLLVCEVADSERALVKLLPDVELAWLEFQVAQMGIFAIDRMSAESGKSVFVLVDLCVGRLTQKKKHNKEGNA